MRGSNLVEASVGTGGVGSADGAQSVKQHRLSVRLASGATVDVPAAFRHLRRLHLDIGTTQRILTFPAAVPLLRPTLLCAVTHLWLRLDYATADTALHHISRMSALQVLRVQLPAWYTIASDVFTLLGRLAALRHLVVLGAQHRGIEPFYDEYWAELTLTLGLRRLRTLEMTTCLRLSPLALPILGGGRRHLPEADAP